MNTRIRFAALSVCVVLVVAPTQVVAQAPPDKEQLEKLAAAGYEADPATLRL